MKHTFSMSLSIFLAALSFCFSSCLVASFSLPSADKYSVWYSAYLFSVYYRTIVHLNTVISIIIRTIHKTKCRFACMNCAGCKFEFEMAKHLFSSIIVMSFSLTMHSVSHASLFTSNAVELMGPNIAHSRSAARLWPSLIHPVTGC